MDKTISSDLDNIVSCLLAVDPYRVVLFGSAAAGKRESESDIDLLVILNSQVFPRTYGKGWQQELQYGIVSER